MERPDAGEDELGGKKALHHEAAYSHEQGEACHNREFVSKREGFCPDERLEVLAMQTCFLEPAMQAVGAACKAEPRCEVKGNGGSTGRTRPIVLSERRAHPRVIQSQLFARFIRFLSNRRQVLDCFS